MDAELREILTDFGRQLESIEKHVEGDGTLMAPGLVGLITQQGKQIETNTISLVTVRRFMDRVRWTVITAAAIGGLLGGGLVRLIDSGTPL